MKCKKKHRHWNELKYEKMRKMSTSITQVEDKQDTQLLYLEERLFYI